MENISHSQPIASILMGKTGHGKSTFSNLLSNSEDFVVGNSTRSCTKEIKLKCFYNQENQVKVSIIDTPGLSDSDGDDKKIIDDIKNYLLKTDIPRINAILIVISIQEKRMDQSLNNLLEEICKIFPLKKFWEHVIIIWTNFNGTESQKKRLEQKAEDFSKEFNALTEDINQRHNINIDTIENFNMIFNEYDIEETDEVTKAKNKAQTISNINKIINLMKNMNPLYAEAKPIIYDVELKEEVQIGKFKVMTYENVQYRIYIDFDNKEIKFRDVISEYKIKREDSETEFEPFHPMEDNNKRISNKYRKYIYYDTDDKFLKEEKTDEIIDWKTNEDKSETKIENIDENKKSITITKYILECTKDDTNGKKIDIEISEQYIEEWREEEKINKEINENNVGTITHSFFKCLYKIQSGNEIKLSENEIPDKNYKEIFEKDDELKVKIVEENGIQYRINYYDVIRIDSRDLNKKNSTEYIIQESKNTINVYERNEKKEIKRIGNNIYIQNYKISYYIDRDGKENIIDTQKIGDEEEEEIKTIEIYETEGLTKEEINSRKSNKQYPIEYSRIYYKEEINTKDKQKIRIDKTELVIINLQHFSEVINKNNSYILEEYDKEIYIINGQINNDERPKLDLIEYELKEKIENREMSKNNNKIQIQKYKIYYREEPNSDPKIYKEEPFGGVYDEDIQYNYYEKFEVLSKEQIEEKRRNKSYPIDYKIEYYKEELNTQDKQKIMDKTEHVIINLQHFSEVINKNNSYILEEYDKEIYIINGQINNDERPILNRKEYELKVKEGKREMSKNNGKIKIQKYKIYYTEEPNSNPKIYKEEPFGGVDDEDIQYNYYEKYVILSKDQIEEKRRNKSYPIDFKIEYYKKELNTQDKNDILYKSENIEIRLVHSTDFTTNNNSSFFVEYDKELKIINGQQDNNNMIIVNRKEIPLQIRYRRKIINIVEELINLEIYKIYYTIDEKNQEKIFKEELFDKKQEYIQYNSQYEEYEGISKEQIEEKRKNGYYPIKYKIIYYQKELNTERDRKKINKIDEIEITKEEEEELRDDCFLYQYIKEKYYINGNLSEDKSSKKCVNIIPIKVYYKPKIIDINRDNETITIQNYKIYYKIEEDAKNDCKEQYYKEEPDGKPKTEKIEYEYYEELKGITQDEIEKKRKENSYPIEYAKIYYKKEINTIEKLPIKIKYEEIKIFLKHFSLIVRIKNSDLLEEYEQEIFSVNGEIRKDEESHKLNLRYTEKILKRTEPEYKDGNKIKDNWKLFSKNEHTFERYKRYKYIYNFGEPEYSEWERDGVKTYYYD